ncbi:hypothetical protein BCR41DRAFT_391857 [Lobosporangium transversale]|uniref:Uncharacterized protein n=1 Tax=Lobosporangium transversale TaxID=64571 RepID=A0A1Y2H5Q8_9FUNG|nr:hypothetical protein BCR41DRAFT_391857 [Lobosporangium transversale]ORZ28382.1 hypothetical protein BCR41DRAFT_391857 [Lobosporangium transversale]|eukprot:XP_021886067.1 hypothetical protein BCR41DRAFT_391857 [Lobosporangium transversale]
MKKVIQSFLGKKKPKDKNRHPGKNNNNPEAVEHENEYDRDYDYDYDGLSLHTVAMSDTSMNSRRRSLYSLNKKSSASALDRHLVGLNHRGSTQDFRNDLHGNQAKVLKKTQTCVPQPIEEIIEDRRRSIAASAAADTYFQAFDDVVTTSLKPRPQSDAVVTRSRSRSLAISLPSSSIHHVAGKGTCNPHDNHHDFVASDCGSCIVQNDSKTSICHHIYNNSNDKNNRKSPRALPLYMPPSTSVSSSTPVPGAVEPLSPSFTRRPSMPLAENKSQERYDSEHNFSASLARPIFDKPQQNSKQHKHIGYCAPARRGTESDARLSNSSKGVTSPDQVQKAGYNEENNNERLNEGPGPELTPKGKTKFQYCQGYTSTQAQSKKGLKNRLRDSQLTIDTSCCKPVNARRHEQDKESDLLLHELRSSAQEPLPGADFGQIKTAPLLKPTANTHTYTPPSISGIQPAIMSIGDNSGHYSMAKRQNIPKSAPIPGSSATIAVSSATNSTEIYIQDFNYYMESHASYYKDHPDADKRYKDLKIKAAKYAEAMAQAREIAEAKAAATESDDDGDDDNVKNAKEPNVSRLNKARSTPAMMPSQSSGVNKEQMQPQQQQQQHPPRSSGSRLPIPVSGPAPLSGPDGSGTPVAGSVATTTAASASLTTSGSLVKVEVAENTFMRKHSSMPVKNPQACIASTSTSASTMLVGSKRLSNNTGSRGTAHRIIYKGPTTAVDAGQEPSSPQPSSPQNSYIITDRGVPFEMVSAADTFKKQIQKKSRNSNNSSGVMTHSSSTTTTGSRYTVPDEFVEIIEGGHEALVVLPDGSVASNKKRACAPQYNEQAQSHSSLIATTFNNNNTNSDSSNRSNHSSDTAEGNPSKSEAGPLRLNIEDETDLSLTSSNLMLADSNFHHRCIRSSLPRPTCSRKQGHGEGKGEGEGQRFNKEKPHSHIQPSSAGADRREMNEDTKEMVESKCMELDREKAVMVSLPALGCIETVISRSSLLLSTVDSTGMNNKKLGPSFLKKSQETMLASARESSNKSKISYDAALSRPTGRYSASGRPKGNKRRRVVFSSSLLPPRVSPAAGSSPAAVPICTGKPRISIKSLSRKFRNVAKLAKRPCSRVTKLSAPMAAKIEHDNSMEESDDMGLLGLQKDSPLSLVDQESYTIEDKATATTAAAASSEQEMITLEGEELQAASDDNPIGSSCVATIVAVHAINATATSGIINSKHVLNAESVLTNGLASEELIRSIRFEYDRERKRTTATSEATADAKGSRQSYQIRFTGDSVQSDLDYVDKSCNYDVQYNLPFISKQRKEKQCIDHSSKTPNTAHSQMDECGLTTT